MTNAVTKKMATDQEKNTSSSVQFVWKTCLFLLYLTCAVAWQAWEAVPDQMYHQLAFHRVTILLPIVCMTWIIEDLFKANFPVGKLLTCADKTVVCDSLITLVNVNILFTLPGVAFISLFPQFFFYSQIHNQYHICTITKYFNKRLIWKNLEWTGIDCHWNCLSCMHALEHEANGTGMCPCPFHSDCCENCDGCVVVY